MHKINEGVGAKDRKEGLGLQEMKECVQKIKGPGAHTRKEVTGAHDGKTKVV